VCLCCSPLLSAKKYATPTVINLTVVSKGALGQCFLFHGYLPYCTLHNSGRDCTSADSSQLEDYCPIVCDAMYCSGSLCSTLLLANAIYCSIFSCFLAALSSAASSFSFHQLSFCCYFPPLSPTTCLQHTCATFLPPSPITLQPFSRPAVVTLPFVPVGSP
jgi:hypothetical protein